MELYRELKKTTELVKKLFGNSMIGYYVSTVAYLAVAPHILLGNQGNFERIVTIYSTFGVLLWIVAAEFHHQVSRSSQIFLGRIKTVRSLCFMQVQNSVLKWTEHHFARNDLSTDNRLKMFSISHDISSMESTSIAVANKLFAVTYRHLCSVIFRSALKQKKLSHIFGFLKFKNYFSDV